MIIIKQFVNNYPVYKIEAIGALPPHPTESIPTTTTPLTHKSPKINNGYR
jgi:hypothetical protein